MFLVAANNFYLRQIIFFLSVDEIFLDYFTIVKKSVQKLTKILKQSRMDKFGIKVIQKCMIQ